MMPIPLDQTLEQLLAQWQTRIATLSQALLQLETLPTYRAVSGKGSLDATEQGLLQSSYQLFEQFDQLVQVVEQAKQLHQESRGLLGRSQKAQTALDLLQGESLKLSPELASSLLPGLASASSSAMLPQGTLLPVSFQTTRLSRKLNPPTPCRMTPEQLLKQFSTQYQQTLDGLTQLEQRQAQQARERAAAIAQARSLSQQLPQHYAAVQALQADYQQKIAHETETLACPELPSESQLQALTLTWQQLNRHLSTPTDEGCVAIQQWQTAANQMLQDLSKVQAFCQQQLNQRQELRGRLGAIQAKALARGRIEESALTDLAQSAERLLYSNPTPLHQGQRLLQQYERTLNQSA